MALEIFHALPPYPGGKRKLLGQIFRHIPSPAHAPRLIDGFLGAGSISLFAKHRGYHVACNDNAPRSTIVGQALIANDRIQLDDHDLQALCQSNAEAGDFVESTFAPSTFTHRHARFLDTALANLHRFSETKQWLLKLALLHFMFRTRVMGNWGAKTVNEQIDNGDWHEISPAFLKETVSRRLCNHPIDHLRAIAPAINRAICSNGHRHTVSQSDIFNFVAATEGDVAFLDPPYAATSSYEQSLRVVDDVLRGHCVEPDVSGFSRKDALGLLDNLLDASRKYPNLVLTYGNKVCDIAELLRMVRRHRPDAQGIEIKYIHQTGLAGAESREKNRELLLWDCPDAKGEGRAA